MMKMLIARLIFIFMLFCAGSWSAWAVTSMATAKPTPKNATVSASGTPVALPFATTIGNKEAIRLQGHGATVKIPFSIPHGEDVTQIQVSLQGRISQGMSGSVLLEAVSNNQVIEQIALKPGSDLNNQFSIPSSHLDAGFHTLILKLVGVAGDSDSNWVQIDPRTSLFNYLSTPKAIEPRLDHLDWLFDRASLDYAPVVPIYGVDFSDYTEALAYAAQGIGLRYQFLPTHIQVKSLQTFLGKASNPLDAVLSDLPVGSRSALIIGTSTALAPVLRNLGVSAIRNATILVRQFPGHSHYNLLILTGRDSQEVLTAARSFANIQINYPSVAEMAIKNSRIENSAHSEPVPITASPFASASFPLLATGFKTTTLSGFSGPVSVQIWNGGWQREGELSLNLVYSAGMSATSDVNILFNGALEGSIPLNDPTGGKYVKYAVSIPSTEVKSGWNTLTLVPNLIPASTHDFLFNSERANLQLSVFANSTFTWQGGNALQHLDLTALSTAGTLNISHGQTVNLFVPKKYSNHTLSAMTTLIGKTAQRYGAPFSVHTGGLDNLHSGPILAVAPLRQLPQSLLNHLGLTEPSGSNSDWGISRSLQDSLGNEDDQPSHYKFSLTNNGLAFSSSYDGHPLIVFSALNDGTLNKAINTLIGFGLWSQLRGFTDWWEIQGKTIHAVGMESVPFYAFGTSGGIGVWAGHHLWWAIVILLIFATMVSVLIYAMVRRRYHRLPKESAVRPAGSQTGGE